jgi:hypothetical protein
MATTNLNLDTMASNSLQPSVTFNAGVEKLDAAVAGTLAIEFTTDANLTLTEAQYQNSAIVFTDSPTTLTAARDVIFPAHFPHIYVKNSTAQTLTLKKSGQTGVALSAGDGFIIASGATDVVKAALGSAAAPSVQSVVSAATVTPTFADDLVKITAQAAGLTLANPSGTAIPGWGIVIRIKDNGTARSITYGSQYRAVGLTLPTTTVLSKTLYLGCIWNADDTKLDVVSVAQEA